MNFFLFFFFFPHFKNAKKVFSKIFFTLNPSLRDKRPFLTHLSGKNLLETKLVNILDDLVLEDTGALVVEEDYYAEGVLTMLKLKEVGQQDVSEEDGSSIKNPESQPQFVRPFDMGGHSSYLNSQKLFKCGSSLFFLAFQRYQSFCFIGKYYQFVFSSDFDFEEFYPRIGVHLENILR